MLRISVSSPHARRSLGGTPIYFSSIGGSASHLSCRISFSSKSHAGGSCTLLFMQTCCEELRGGAGELSYSGHRNAMSCHVTSCQNVRCFVAISEHECVGRSYLSTYIEPSHNNFQGPSKSQHFKFQAPIPKSRCQETGVASCRPSSNAWQVYTTRDSCFRQVLAGMLQGGATHVLYIYIYMHTRV